MNQLLLPPEDLLEPLPVRPIRRTTSFQAARVWGLLGLLPGVGLVFGPVALGLGLRDFRAARGTARAGLALAGIVLGLLGLLVQAAALAALVWWGGDWLPGLTGLTADNPSRAPDCESNVPAPPVEAKKVLVGKNVWVEIQADKRRVLVSASVCMREGQLEQLLTRKTTKEHEAVLAADVDARDIHQALLVAGAKEGSPVKFQPKYTPASGSVIKVSLQYEEKGKLNSVPAQSWVRNVRTKKDLEHNWVFGGSRLVADPFDPQKERYYLANDGDVICLSNFETAMLDLPIKSSREEAFLAFEAHTELIPPLNTKVVVVLEPVPEKK